MTPNTDTSTSPPGLLTSILPLPLPVRYPDGQVRETVGELYVPVMGKRGIRAAAQRLPLSRAGTQTALALLVMAPIDSVYTVTYYDSDAEREAVLVFRKISSSHWQTA